MKDRLIVKTLEQLKVIAHPLRLRIFETLQQKPMTTKQVALLLEEKPTKLYHHVSALEQAGLVKLVETRQNRGTLEKYYQSVGESIELDPQIFGPDIPADESTQAMLALFSTLLQTTLADIQRSIAARHLKPKGRARTALVYRETIRASRAHIDALREKLREVTNEWETSDDEQGEETYNLTLVCYPVLNKQSDDTPQPRSKANDATR